MGVPRSGCGTHAARFSLALSRSYSGTQKAKAQQREAIDDEHNNLIRVLAVDDHSAIPRGIALFVGTDPDMQAVAEATQAMFLSKGL